jgi:chorismate mutase
MKNDFISFKTNIIAGPCAAESKDQILRCAKELKERNINMMRVGIWKPRTKPGGFEGIGEPAFEWMKEAANLYNIEYGCEVANKSQVNIALDNGCNYIWIGARTTTDPFAVQEIADTLNEHPRKNDIFVFVKNPMCPDLDLWEGAIQRIYNTGIRKIGAIYRGFKTYNETKYRNENIWKIPLDIMIKYPSLTMLCDSSHIAGDRQYLQEISDAAINVYNFDGLILESHYDPSCALTDAKQQLKPCDLVTLLDNISKSEIKDNASNVENNVFNASRIRIDDIDNLIIDLLAERLVCSKTIGEYKKSHNIKLYQPDRYNSMLEKYFNKCKSLGLDEKYIRDIWDVIHEYSIEIQSKL